MNRILIWAIEQDFEVVETKAIHLLDTARKFNISVETLGIGQTFTTFRDRLHLLQDYLKTIDPEDIVLIMDAYDTLFNSTSEVIFDKFKSKNTRILISAEKMYTYQYHQFLHKYDTIESEYRYVNAGTYMGYAGDVLKMVNELFEVPFDSQIDQGLMGIWLYDNFENTEKVQLDTNCDVFWITSGDYFELKDIAEAGNELINPYTNTKPSIIHNTGNAAPVHYETYIAVYKNIMKR